MLIMPGYNDAEKRGREAGGIPSRDSVGATERKNCHAVSFKETFRLRAHSCVHTLGGWGWRPHSPPLPHDARLEHKPPDSPAYTEPLSERMRRFGPRRKGGGAGGGAGARRHGRWWRIGRHRGLWGTAHSGRASPVAARQPAATNAEGRQKSLLFSSTGKSYDHDSHATSRGETRAARRTPPGRHHRLSRPLLGGVPKRRPDGVGVLGVPSRMPDLHQTPHPSGGGVCPLGHAAEIDGHDRDLARGWVLVPSACGLRQGS